MIARSPADNAPHAATRFVLRAGQQSDAAALGAFLRERFDATFGHTYAPEDLEQFLDASYAPDVMAAQLNDASARHLLAWEGEQGVPRQDFRRDEEACPPGAMARFQGIRGQKRLVENAPTQKISPLSDGKPDPTLPISGLVGAAQVGPMSLPLAAPIPSGAFELKRLYLAPAAMGTGLADTMMNWAFSVAKTAGADDLYLGVWSQNDRANRFYARHGFRKVGDYLFPVGKALDHEWILHAAIV